MVMPDTYHYGPDGQDQKDGSSQDQQGYNYGYKYSYGSGSGRGTAPGGHKPPRHDDNWGEWIGIGVMLLAAGLPA